MSNPRGGVMSRLGSQKTMQYASRGVNNQHNGKPYDRPKANSLSGLKSAPKNTKTKQKMKGQLPVKKYGVIFGGLTPIATNPTIDPPPRVCFNCWQPGHAKKDCKRPIVSKMCHNCGRRGVELPTCPRCRSSHARYLAYSRGETLDERELEALFPPGREFKKSDGVQVQVVLNEDKSLDGRLFDEQDDRERRMRNYYDEQERELTYEEPRAKFTEEREYVRNPVSRNRDEEEDEEEERRRRGRLRRGEDEYKYEERERSYDERERSYDERERSFDEREEREREYSRYRERESSEDRSVERRRGARNAPYDLDADPVHEVLELTRSIAHLSAETQELIMRQVMAERKEKARLRASQHRVDEEDWP